jgi:hypothetical protein
MVYGKKCTEMTALASYTYGKSLDIASSIQERLCDGNIDSPTFGQVRKAAPPRIGQVALKFSF